MKKILLIFLGLVVALGLITAAAQAETYEDYPNKPITLMLPYAPGGGSDVTATQVGPVWESYLGQRIVKEFKPGSGGEVGWSEYANKPADSYRIALIAVPSFITNIISRPDTVLYKVDDYVMIGNAVADIGGIFVPNNSPFQTIQDLIDYAKKNPGEVTIGHTGMGSDAWFAYHDFQNNAGVQLAEVAFEGDGPNMVAAMGGHIDSTLNKFAIVASAVRDGYLRPLVLFNKERLDSFPNIPTAKEVGVNVTDWASTRGFAVRKGTPQAVIDKLSTTLEKAVKDDKFINQSLEIDLMPSWMSGSEYVKHMENVKNAYTKIWEAVGNN